MIRVRRYQPEQELVWNQFNEKSKTSLFMFDRHYMDYHKDRFIDHSLLFYEEDKLIAILPLTEHGSKLISHGGLTYGGFITNYEMKQHIMDDCFKALVEYAGRNHFDQIDYKIIPHIYHNQPAEEDRYALFYNNAALAKVEASTVINLKEPLKMPKGRKAQISRARREGVLVEERESLEYFNSFIALENSVLRDRHKTKAVHTGEELKYLHDQLPNNVHLYVAIYEEKIIAGAVIYEYMQVIHTQYMAADDTARKIGALDLVIATIMEQYKVSKTWLDFGISTEEAGKYLNEGLIAQKEGFGGRTMTYEMWRVEV